MICNIRVDVDEVVGNNKNCALDEGSLSPKFWIYNWVYILIIPKSFVNLNFNCIWVNYDKNKIGWKTRIPQLLFFEVYWGFDLLHEHLVQVCVFVICCYYHFFGGEKIKVWSITPLVNSWQKDQKPKWLKNVK